jgi:hypothetical protein
MPHGNCLAMPQVTAVDEQFGTHTKPGQFTVNAPVTPATTAVA